MTLQIPASMLPSDGRFGSGPSKVRTGQVEALVAAGDPARPVLGTSHRQAPVKDLVHRVRTGLTELFDLPAGYEVALGNGGSTAFWEVATASLVRRRAQHAVFGEFGAKFAAATARAPFLDDPEVVEAAPGTVAHLTPSDAVDVYATPHNETSTGAVAPVRRPGGPDQLLLTDATSGAGALPVDLHETDVYYFGPQKAFAADGGLWLALCSPAAVERAREVESSGDGRWVPEFLSLTTALENSRQDQTLNTPAVGTLVMLADQVEWLLEHGGLDWSVRRCERSAQVLYGWAAATPWATPFVTDPAERSPVVGTIDLDPSVDAGAVVGLLRDHGILDVFPYRKLGRNQLRVGMFPAVDPDDVAALTECITYVVDRLG
ncbi:MULTISPECIES: phosphoserine transaminase [unclassified Isoptericola]|uniref:phosphoserine transaminase n=1 Tax=unclassified Isoptericola TaxID=2623355 RepID=UPI0027140BBA|nr:MULTISPECIES: phosphoserine transaminase [unclassified Isoptericola]MDO8149377.1 phosphoserine transaminase [Isoptericola sp. b515]MDO8152324.1 phosphoserine transaminase [Isoptericola sp. b408]